MEVVYRYPLGGQPKAAIEMPTGAKIIHVSYQSSVYGTGMMLWAVVDEDAALETRTFEWFATGKGKDELGKHIATLENKLGMVMHLFETTRLK